jgi:D-tyrosyl-tRNA(Tyr) deacylase
MITVLQRVLKAKVTVDGQPFSEIGPGLLILLGIRKGDTEDKARVLARRCVQMRIFEDPDGKFNRSLEEVRGEALVVSQFTLLADTARGRRPSFTDAEVPDRARILYEFFLDQLVGSGITARGGKFGARMIVALENNGPVTIITEE